MPDPNRRGPASRRPPSAPGPVRRTAILARAPFASRPRRGDLLEDRLHRRDPGFEGADWSGVGDQAVSEHAHGDGLDVVGKHEAPAGDHRMRPGGCEETDRGPRASAETDERVLAAGSDDGDGVGRDRWRDRKLGDDSLSGGERGRSADGRQRGRATAAPRATAPAWSR